MADENNGQLELDFPDPDGFPSYDDVDPDDGQAELSADSFVETAVSDDEMGCCIR